MRLHSNPLIQTVDLRNVPCSPLACPVLASNQEWTTPGFTASDESKPG